MSLEAYLRDLVAVLDVAKVAYMVGRPLLRVPRGGQ